MEGVPDSRSGLTIGDFVNQNFPVNNLALQDTVAKTPPAPLSEEKFSVRQ
jgi:hypothetical protein